MKLSEIKSVLNGLEQVNFILPSGNLIPNHFHVTEVGLINKNFIDCGGVLRNESVISFQLFTANDYDHRLSASKLKSIIELSESKLGLKDLDIEVEYQGDTIGKYGLGFDGENFQLVPKQTDCLATDNCGIPSQKPKIKLSSIGQSQISNCNPESGCC